MYRDVDIYVCMYTVVHAYVHIMYMYTYTCTCTCMCTSTYICTCVHNVYMYMCMYRCIYMYMCIYIYICIYTYVHARKTNVIALCNSFKLNFVCERLIFTKILDQEHLELYNDLFITTNPRIVLAMSSLQI